MKYTATLSAVQVGQAVKSLLLLGERKITIEETEKDRFVVTTTTETALSKKSTKGDKVKVLKAVTYTGKAFKTYYDKYDVIEAAGDRVVIGIGKTVTAAVNAANLKKA